MDRDEQIELREHRAEQERYLSRETQEVLWNRAEALELGLAKEGRSLSGAQL